MPRVETQNELHGIRVGQHTVLTASSTQVPIALSSAEAEFYGNVKTASRLIGIGGLARDLGFEFELEQLTGSSAAQGILARRGTGKIKHLETHTLWLQRAVAAKQLSIGRVPGVSNGADIGTKFLPEGTIAKLLAILNLEFRLQRDTLALKARSG